MNYLANSCQTRLLNNCKANGGSEGRKEGNPGFSRKAAIIPGQCTTAIQGKCIFLLIWGNEISTFIPDQLNEKFRVQMKFQFRSVVTMSRTM